MRTTRILAAALTAVALTACGGTTDGATPDPAATDDQQADAPADEPTAPAPEADEDDEPAPADEPSEATPQEDDELAADCSSAAVDGTLRAGDAPEGTVATARFVLDAVVRCDEQLLTTAATESGTSFLFGNATVGDVFALPEDTAAGPAGGPSGWDAAARLLTGTTPVRAGDGAIWTWPAAAGPDADDADWQELVDSGLYTAEQVEDLRAAPDGYLGWRIGIDADGTWVFMTAGD